MRPGVRILLLLQAAGCLQAPPAGEGGHDGGSTSDGAGGADASVGYRTVSGHFRHFCAAVDGSAWCWGDNGSGQLGDGTKLHRSTAVRVLRAEGVPLEGVVQLAPGEKHTCARLADRTVTCWGANSAGQLGRGVDDDTEYPYADAEAINLVDVVDISSGGAHSCARRADGTVVCWGRGLDGELGDGAYTDRPAILLPVAEGGLPLVTSQVTAGRYHTCFIDDGGAVACTGWNEDGQSGQRDGSPPETTCDYPMAGEVSRESGASVTGATDVAGGFRHTCAVAGEEVLCFGHSRCGELGDGDASPCGASPADDGSCLETTLRLYPVAVMLPGTCQPDRLAVGYSHSCLLCADRTVQCWGSGSRGRLGQGTIEQHETPVEVMEIESTVALASGAESSCAAMADGTIACWGSAEFGQLGDGTGPEEGNTALYHTLPRAVVGLPLP